MLLPLLIMLPHSATGGWAPNPKNDNPAISIIMVPISSIEVTRIGPAIFGSTCRKIICKTESPANWEACIYGRFFMDNVCPLAILEYLGQLIKASAITAFLTPPSRIAATVIANTRPGNARHTSEILIITESTIPP